MTPHPSPFAWLDPLLGAFAGDAVPAAALEAAASRGATPLTLEPSDRRFLRAVWIDVAGRTPLPDEWKRVLAVAVLCAINVIFWGVYEQQGNTMQLWADKNTNWHFLGFNIPSTWYQAFNPFMIFIFAPLLNQFWAWQSKSRNEPSSVVKMGIGCLLVGLSYVVMIAAAQGTGPDERRTVMWLVGMTFIITIGELYLSPIGLSFVTKVAPAKIVSMMMGVWFLANFFGNYLSGYLGTFWEKMPRESYFLLLTVLGVVAGGAIFILARPINKVVSRHDRMEATA
jgi:POT family proton-dependent oligopeptide transporter